MSEREPKGTREAEIWLIIHPQCIQQLLFEKLCFQRAQILLLHAEQAFLGACFQKHELYSSATDL